MRDARREGSICEDTAGQTDDGVIAGERCHCGGRGGDRSVRLCPRCPLRALVCGRCRSSRCPTRSRWRASRARSPICRTARLGPADSRSALQQHHRTSRSSSTSDRKVHDRQDRRGRPRAVRAACRPARPSRPWPTSTASISSRRNFRRRREGGIRLMLVATDTSKGAAAAAGAPAADRTGRHRRPVAHRHRSRARKRSSVYYLLDIVNNASGAGQPAGAVRVRHADRRGRHRRSWRARRRRRASKDQRVTVQGPFAPGRTLVQVARDVPAGTASLELTQRFPAAARAARGGRQESRRHDADVAAAHETAGDARRRAKRSSRRPAARSPRDSRSS